LGLDITENIVPRAGMVILDKIATDSSRGHLIGTESLHEETSRVTEHMRFEADDIWDCGSKYFHYLE